MPAMLLPLLLAARLAAADSSWEVPDAAGPWADAAGPWPWDAAGPWAGLTEERIKKMPLSEVLSLLRMLGEVSMRLSEFGKYSLGKKRTNTPRVYECSSRFGSDGVLWC